MSLASSSINVVRLWRAREQPFAEYGYSRGRLGRTDGYPRTRFPDFRAAEGGAKCLSRQR